MARVLRLGGRAQSDVDRLLAFQARRSKRLRAAAELRIAEALQLVGEHPLIGFEVGGAYRQVVLRFGAGGYVVRYRVTDDEIIVTRLWHTSEDRPR